MIIRLWKDKFNEYADVLPDGLHEPIFFVAMNIKVTAFNDLCPTTVVCYMKYFDKLIRGAVTRKYPLIQIYMYDDVFLAAETPSKESTIRPSTSNMMSNEAAIDLTKDEKDNVQFFTPSTKVMIDEISASTQTDAGEVCTQSGCKRVLSLGDVPKATANVKIEPPDDMMFYSRLQW